MMTRVNIPRLSLSLSLSLSLPPQFLDDISSNLYPSHVDLLFERVTQIPYTEYVEATLNLIKELTRYQFKQGSTASVRAMELLWNIMQDENQAPDDIIIKARDKVRHENVIMSLDLM